MTQPEHTTDPPHLAPSPDLDRPPTTPVDSEGSAAAIDATPQGKGEARRGGDGPTDDLEATCAQQARRIKDLARDLHALSHSIRSPLVALKGFAGLLEEEASSSLGDNGRHFLGRIAEAGRRIEWRLNDLAQLLVVTEQSPSRNWVDVAPLVEALGAEFKPALDETGMRILFSQDPPLVYCDRAQLEVALRHLVGNALQHGAPSEPRHVQIRIERDETSTHVTVVDGGPGMDEALARRAFTLFDCAGERTRRFDDGRESSGIGLALVERIAEAHGGSVRLDTAPARGTSVVITFPHE